MLPKTKIFRFERIHSDAENMDATTRFATVIPTVFLMDAEAHCFMKERYIRLANGGNPSHNSLDWQWAKLEIQKARYAIESEKVKQKAETCASPFEAD